MQQEGASANETKISRNDGDAKVHSHLRRLASGVQANPKEVAVSNKRQGQNAVAIVPQRESKVPKVLRDTFGDDSKIGAGPSRAQPLDTSELDLCWVVYSGRGTRVYNKPGNRHFLDLILGNVTNYITAGNRLAKKAIVDRIKEQVYANGGCFVEQAKGELFELSDSSVDDKIRHAFTDVDASQLKKLSVEDAIAKIQNQQVLKKPREA